MDTTTAAAKLARIKVCVEPAQRRMDTFNDRIDPYRADFQRQLNAVSGSRDPPWIRLRRLYAIADQIMSHSDGLTACTRGCNHCCHIPVALTSEEAKMLGAKVGRKPKLDKAKMFRDISGLPFGYDYPCPFLDGKECSIYEDRPLACRIHVNVDDIPLLCELEPTSPEPIRVPSMDTTWIVSVYYAICGYRMADIREYFPRR